MFEGQVISLFLKSVVDQFQEVYKLFPVVPTAGLPPQIPSSTKQPIKGILKKTVPDDVPLSTTETKPVTPVKTAATAKTAKTAVPAKTAKTAVPAAVPAAVKTAAKPAPATAKSAAAPAKTATKPVTPVKTPVKIAVPAAVETGRLNDAATEGAKARIATKPRKTIKFSSSAKKRKRKGDQS